LGVRAGLVGAKLIAEFHWILYLFGAFLIITGVKMLVMKTDHTDPNQNIVVRAARRLFPVTARFHGEHFFVRAGTPASQEGELPGARILADEVVERTKPCWPSWGPARYNPTSAGPGTPASRLRPRNQQRLCTSWGKP
jgi:hypothetical protein